MHEIFNSQFVLKLEIQFRITLRKSPFGNMQLYCFFICNIQNKTKCLYRVDREVGNSLFSLQSAKFLQDRYIPLTFNV